MVCLREVDDKVVSIENGTAFAYYVEFKEKDKLIYSIFINRHSVVSIPSDIYKEFDPCSIVLTKIK